MQIQQKTRRGTSGKLTPKRVKISNLTYSDTARFLVNGGCKWKINSKKFLFLIVVYNKQRFGKSIQWKCRSLDGFIFYSKQSTNKQFINVYKQIWALAALPVMLVIR